MESNICENPHCIERKVIRGKPITLLFFDREFERIQRLEKGISLEQYNHSKYVQMILTSEIITKDNYVKRWFIIDKLGNHYRIKKTGINRDAKQTQITIKIK